MIYVISDLHGYPFEKFENTLKKIGFSKNDFLFVLGDVIDKGTDGVKYLKWLMIQDNAELILGNHEAILLSCDFLFEEIDENSIKKLTTEKLTFLSLWQENGGNETLSSLYQISSEERQYIAEYLREAPLYDCISIKDKDYLFTHSGLGNFSKSKKISDYSADELLWNRPNINERYFENITTVFGHTPTFYYGEEHKGKILITDTWIDIDVGVGQGFTPVLLCLDNMTSILCD